MGSKKSRMDEGNTGKEIKRKKQRPALFDSMSSDERRVYKKWTQKAKSVHPHDSDAQKRLANKVDQEFRAIGSKLRWKAEWQPTYSFAKDKMYASTQIAVDKGKKNPEDKMLKDIGRMEKSNDRKNKKK